MSPGGFIFNFPPAEGGGLFWREGVLYFKNLGLFSSIPKGWPFWTGTHNFFSNKILDPSYRFSYLRIFKLQSDGVQMFKLSLKM